MFVEAIDDNAGATYAANTEMNSKMALGSVNATPICFLSKALFLMPVSLPATRLTAMSRWRCFKNHALDGESGRRNQITKAHMQVTPPSYNIVRSAKYNSDNA